jgi:predicted DNA binding CopG/RHH family protein
MAKKQITIQLSVEVIDAVKKEAKKTNKAKQAVINDVLKGVYGIK